jgi:hypothetical protein
MAWRWWLQAHARQHHNQRSENATDQLRLASRLIGVKATPKPRDRLLEFHILYIFSLCGDEPRPPGTEVPTTDERDVAANA